MQVQSIAIDRYRRYFFRRHIAIGIGDTFMREYRYRRYHFRRYRYRLSPYFYRVSLTTLLFGCNLCAYNTETFTSFRSHYVRHHKNDPNFHIACCIDSCYTSKNWTNYRVHVHRKHRNVVYNAASTASAVALQDTDHFTCADGEVLNNPAHFNSRFTLSLAARHNLSQVAIDNVAASSSILIENHLNLLKQQLKNKRKFCCSCR